jgi:hypothetical protein
MKRLSWTLTGLLAFATTSVGDNSKTSETPSVNSTSGRIIGHRAASRPNTYEFLGIKYGQAPIGELRFASPKRYLAPEGTVFEASKWVNLRSPYEDDTAGLIQRTERRLPSRYTTCDDFSQFHRKRFRYLQSVHGSSREPTR